MKATMDKLVNLCKGRGIIYPGSEIYGGMGNTWDYGPVGVEIKNNIKRAWWKRFVQEDWIKDYLQLYSSFVLCNQNEA